MKTNVHDFCRKCGGIGIVSLYRKGAPRGEARWAFRCTCHAGKRYEPTMQSVNEAYAFTRERQDNPEKQEQKKQQQKQGGENE